MIKYLQEQKKFVQKYYYEKSDDNQKKLVRKIVNMFSIIIDLQSLNFMFSYKF